MSRESEVHIRDRLMMLAESAQNPHRPFNVKRKSLSLTKQPSRSGTKLSMQDFVRMDPGYTPDIEHLVFPSRKRNPQQVAPINHSPGKTRSRLAEMFALSRHIQQRSADRETKSRNPTINRSVDSVLDSRGGSSTTAANSSSLNAATSVRVSNETARRWVSAIEEPVKALPVRQNTTGGNTSSSSNARLSPVAGLAVAESDMTTARGPNVSVLHLRSTSEPWETGITSSVFTTSAPTSRPYSSNRNSGVSSAGPTLTKHQSLGANQAYKWTNPTSSSFHASTGGEMPSSSGVYIGNNCNRELSPVRWCDREVDGVYLGRSGWVQVHQRSLDDNRRVPYKSEVGDLSQRSYAPGSGVSSANVVTISTSSLQSNSRRTGIKLSDYHCNSEPGGNCPEITPSTVNRQSSESSQRPIYLSLQTRDFERKSNTPSPARIIPESFSPPSITPIISPPPAFQDKDSKSAPKTRTFFGGKPPFLPRSDAIVDSDNSPPLSPVKWKSSVKAAQSSRKPKGTQQSSTVVTGNQPQPSTDHPTRVNDRNYTTRIPQTKSLEDTTANRRSQFVQRYGESSSSSSSSMGFRSLDSCVSRPVMPRLSENTDSSIDIYEDADEEDNNSSSINISLHHAPVVNQMPTIPDCSRTREKTSPSGRSSSGSNKSHHRSQTRRSPAGSDTNKPASPSSSSTSSNDFPPSRSPSGSTQQLRRSAPTRQYQHAKSTTHEDPSIQRVRRSRSLQLPDKKNPSTVHAATRVSPQHADPHRVVIKMGNSTERKRHAAPIKPPNLEGDLDEEMLREAELVTGFLYGSRTRAAAQALLMQRYSNNLPPEDISSKDMPKPSNNGLTVYFVGGNAKAERPKVLHRGSTTPNLPVKQVFGTQQNQTSQDVKNPCTPESCDFWPHCANRDTLNREAQSMMRLSQTYPSHQRSLDSSESRSGSKDRASQEPHWVPSGPNQDQYKKRTSQSLDHRVPTSHVSRKQNNESPYLHQHENRTYSVREKRVSPSSVPKRDNMTLDIEKKIHYNLDVEKKYYQNEPKTRAPHYLSERSATVDSDKKRDSDSVRKVSPVNPAKCRVVGNVSSSSSSSDVWVTGSDRTVAKSPRNVKSSGASTPLEEGVGNNERAREMILTRPGSAPAEERSDGFVSESQQRSMSLPKSFLSASYQQGGQLPWRRRGTESLGSSPGLRRKTATSGASHTAPVTPLHEGSRRRSPLGDAVRRAKAASTPQLLETQHQESRKWHDKSEEIRLNPSGGKEYGNRRNFHGNTAESVLQKFRKTFSLRFQKRGSKENYSTEIAETLSEILGEPSEEESPQHVPSAASSQLDLGKEEQSEQKYRFGPLIWRSSKERKKLNKAARSAKCNSGDSGIQIEMVPGCGGGAGGDSSESHDTDPDPPPDVDDLLDSPLVRRRPPLSHTKSSRPHSDLLNQILIDKFKADLKQRAHKHQQVRRTRSDLGGQRLLHWDPRSSYRRMMSSPAPLRGRPQSPRKKPPDAPDGVQLRLNHRRGQLRRSLSQPLDIDKLSPLMRTKTAGLRLGGAVVLSEDEHDHRNGTSDDEVMSDSESSVTSLTERKKSLESAMDEEMTILAEAVFDHVAIEAEELAFRAGDVIEVLETANRDWWWGSCNGTSGWFPAHFVRLRVSQEDTVEDCLAAMASGRSVPSQIRRRTSISLLSNDQVRTSVVRELVNTERDFVKVLQDVAEGYIYECRKRTDMFTEKQIQTIFINLEDILKFQTSFLKELESCINWEAPYKSCIGTCFLKYKGGFKMYSDYCNSHPMATGALQELYQFNSYNKFFEACRLMRGLIEIPLDGYLLTPVQRICKYPLQLAELLKYTKAEHPDYSNIREALDAMRGVAVLINERKRRMESLEKLAAWQQRVEQWEGEDLIEVSSQLIHHGDVVRVTTGMWTNNITLFLFDHQIVYCKKDILKRNTYVYKGRICLNTSEVIDVSDGKDVHLGVSVRHAIKLYSCVRDKWLLFCCRSSSDKQRWLEAFAEERRLVAEDKTSGLDLPPAARQMARVAARCQRRPPRKPRNGKNFKHESTYMGSTLQLNTSSHNSNSLGRKVGTWFTFGANKKTRHQHRDVS